MNVEQLPSSESTIRIIRSLICCQWLNERGKERNKTKRSIRKSNIKKLFFFRPFLTDRSSTNKTNEKKPMFNNKNQNQFDYLWWRKKNCVLRIAVRLLSFVCIWLRFSKRKRINKRNICIQYPVRSNDNDDDDDIHIDTVSFRLTHQRFFFRSFFFLLLFRKSHSPCVCNELTSKKNNKNGLLPKRMIRISYLMVKSLHFSFWNYTFWPILLPWVDSNRVWKSTICFGHAKETKSFVITNLCESSTMLTICDAYCCDASLG